MTVHIAGEPIDVPSDDKVNFYRGVPNELVMVIGKLAIVAGNLEGLGHQIAAAVGLEKVGGLNFNPLTKAIRSRVADAGIPDCVGRDHAEVVLDLDSWCIEATAAMDSRHPVIHAISFFRKSAAGDYVPTRRHIRPGTEFQDYSDPLLDTLSSLETVWRRGWKLHLELLHDIGDARMNHYIDPSSTDQTGLAAALVNYPQCPFA